MVNIKKTMPNSPISSSESIFNPLNQKISLIIVPVRIYPMIGDISNLFKKILRTVAIAMVKNITSSKFSIA